MSTTHEDLNPARMTIDADHAAALEREQIAAWLASIIIDDRTSWSARHTDGDAWIELRIMTDRIASPRALIAAIRDGRHWADVPMSGPESAHTATNSPRLVSQEGSADFEAGEGA